MRRVVQLLRNISRPNHGQIGDHMRSRRSRCHRSSTSREDSGRSGAASRIFRSVTVCLLAFAAIAVLPVGAQAEPLSNAGKEFWLGFPSNIQGEETATQTLYITGGTATTGTVA